MMIIDLIDELDIIEGIHQRVPNLDKKDPADMSELLQSAAQTANEEEWAALNLWLGEVCQDITLLLPEIKQALCSQWQGERALTDELASKLSS
ncbi:hypothetical protein OA92_02285 [Marinomonas sp. SBI22]|jgi:dsDNA-binding SOS-regulon protein|uniref:hypothetical protein n=1 Tax=unclassified Marinomonas TaxID=196814 RepID=UPI0005FA661D|nr:MULTISPECIES: hypothetical protein [unclassified Marinomonas]KJZ10990.1 hypothetical protein TW85_18225 [Marinomonas sp. S3726]KZM40797.1 hypothetical protein OA91_19210 [Marinomonas sp. SBI8L]KZM46018.1 hypothetical protein OA92_02285 [Marinomonas sp. SBI22]